MAAREGIAHGVMLHERHLPTPQPVTLAGSDFQVRRPVGDEYADPSALAYEVRLVEVMYWSVVGLPNVVEVRLSIAGHSFAEVISAVKDLYDPRVAVLIDGVDAVALVPGASPGVDALAQGHRNVVIDLSASQLPAATSLEHRAILGQLLCKDTALEFDSGSMTIGVPGDLNAAAGNEVYVWGEETVIWRLEPRLRTGWSEQILAVNAFMTAAREGMEQRLHEVQSLWGDRTSPEDALRRLVESQASHELLVQARLDSLRVSLSRPMASYTNQLAEHCNVAESADRFRRLVDQTMRAISLEVQLVEKDAARRSAQAAADVRIVVAIFAIVSVLANVVALSLAITALPPGSASRFRHLEFGFGVALLLTIAAVAIAVLLVVSARSQVNEARRSRYIVVACVAAVLALAGLMLVSLTRSGTSAVVGLVLAGVGMSVAAVALTRTLRLASTGPG